MRHIILNQIANFADESKKLADRMVLFRENDLHLLDGHLSIGCRLMAIAGAGTSVIQVNGKTFNLGKNDFLNVLEGTDVGFSSMSPDAELCCIFTTRKFILDSMQGVPPVLHNYILRILTEPVMKLSPSEAAVLLRQAGLLEEALGNLKHRYREDLVRLYLKGLMLELNNIMIERYGSGNDAPVGDLKKSDLLMAGFMDLVWKNLHKTREVSFYAKELCVTPKHLSRVVKDAAGKSPHEIIADELLTLSMQLLQNEGMLVQQIADVLHFSDQAAFSKFFKKYTGLSPAEYRKRMDGQVMRTSSGTF